MRTNTWASALPSIMYAASLLCLLPMSTGQAHAQETRATAAPISVPVSTPASTAVTPAAHCPTESSDMRVPGSCLLGATLGTFIFPGLGTALGCAGLGALSWGWGKLADTDRSASSGAASTTACTAGASTPVASR